MIAHIYSPAKTAAQSGSKKTGGWVLKYQQQQPKMIEPLMGYTSSQDTQAEVNLSFQTKEQAISFAERNNLSYIVIEPHSSKRQIKSYADNFRADRKLPWTH